MLAGASQGLQDTGCGNAAGPHELDQEVQLGLAGMNSRESRSGQPEVLSMSQGAFRHAAGTTCRWAPLGKPAGRRPPPETGSACRPPGAAAPGGLPEGTAAGVQTGAAGHPRPALHTRQAAHSQRPSLGHDDCAQQVPAHTASGRPCRRRGHSCSIKRVLSLPHSSPTYTWQSSRRASGQATGACASCPA